MEADDDANNKELIGNRMLANVWLHGIMMEEIFSEVGAQQRMGRCQRHCSMIF